MPQRRQSLSGWRCRIGSQVKKWWPAAGNRTPCSRLPAAGVPRAVDWRQSTRDPASWWSGAGEDMPSNTPVSAIATAVDTTGIRGAPGR